MNSKKSYTASLPAKRMGSGCLFLDGEQRILLVRPTYKPTWEIPGGVVEQNESPKQCCLREVREELGLERSIQELLVVDYNSETEERTESLMFIFNGGALNEADVSLIVLRLDELSEFRFFNIDHLPEDMTPTLQRRVTAAWQQAQKRTDTYRENQQHV